MAGISTDEKRFLNYQGASFKRSLYYLGGATATYLACIFIKFKPAIPAPSEVAGPPMVKILLGFAALCLTLSAILDALFVWYQNYLRSQLFAFDQENFYIIRKDGTEQIPLQNIFEITLTSSGVQKGVRGYSNNYRISYNSNGEQKDVLVGIYYRMRVNFNDFKQIVSSKNPSVKIKNWATSLDPIFRLFKKSKSRETGDLFK
jgi:hypothetical protein